MGELIPFGKAKLPPEFPACVATEPIGGGKYSIIVGSAHFITAGVS
jgi:hypothetical protein